MKNLLWISHLGSDQSCFKCHQPHVTGSCHPEWHLQRQLESMPTGHLLFELKTPVDQMLRKLFPGTTLYISQECFQTLLEVSEAFSVVRIRNQREFCVLATAWHTAPSPAFAYAGSSTQPALLAHLPHGLMPTLRVGIVRQAFYSPSQVGTPVPT